MVKRPLCGRLDATTNVHNGSGYASGYASVFTKTRKISRPHSYLMIGTLLHLSTVNAKHFSFFHSLSVRYIRLSKHRSSPKQRILKKGRFIAWKRHANRPHPELVRGLTMWRKLRGRKFDNARLLKKESVFPKFGYNCGCQNPDICVKSRSMV